MNKPDPLLLAVLSAINEGPETPAKGFRTAKQLSKEWGKAYCTTANMLAKALKAGAVEKRIYRIRYNSVIRCIPHYGPVEKPTKRLTAGKR